MHIQSYRANGAYESDEVLDQAAYPCYSNSMRLDREAMIDISTIGKSSSNLWTVKHDELPFTVNAARNFHHHKLAKEVRKWREIGFWRAKEAGIPKMESVELHCMSLLKRANRDYGAEVLAAKALIDGIVDAGVIPDDKPPHVVSLTLHAPYKWDLNALVMAIVKLE